MSAAVVVTLKGEDGLTYLQMDVWELIAALSSGECAYMPLNDEMHLTVTVKGDGIDVGGMLAVEAERPAAWGGDS